MITILMFLLGFNGHLPAYARAPSIAITADATGNTPDYQALDNPILEWIQTSSFHLPGPKSDASTSLLWLNGIATLFYNFWSVDDMRTYSVIATGPDLFHLVNERAITIGEDLGITHRWFETVLPGANGALYAIYHSEERSPCIFYYKSPGIGIAKSTDNGRTWTNLGIVLKVADSEEDCRAANGFFAGGNGDVSAVFDRDRKYIYIVYTNYPMRDQLTDQGIAFARLAIEDLDQPVGRVWKWYNGSYSQPGIDGLASSILKPVIDFRAPNPEGYWGPSVHYNTFLKKYLMLLSRTRDGNSVQQPLPTEGIYVSLNDDISNPAGWSEPTKIVAGGHWYPQFIGTKVPEDSNELGERGRFFMENESFFEVRFK